MLNILTCQSKKLEKINEYVFFLHIFKLNLTITPNL